MRAIAVEAVRYALLEMADRYSAGNPSARTQSTTDCMNAAASTEDQKITFRAVKAPLQTRVCRQYGNSVGRQSAATQ